jgi:ABC-type uncharacterized transport system YnjBCD permease subunit
MENKSHSAKPVLLIMAFILLAIALYIQVSWIVVFNMEKLVTPADKTAYYMSHFPSFLQNSITLVFIAFLVSSGAFILSALSLNKLKNGLKGVAYLTIAVSLIVALLSLFQLM